MQSGPRHPVIVADDDAELCLVLEELLTEAGYMVFLASTGAEVLDVIGQGVRPCLLVCDVRMPGLSLTDLLARVAANPRTSDVPIALMTGGELANLPETAWVFRKPFDLFDLLDVTSEAVRRIETRRRAANG